MSAPTLMNEKARRELEELERNQPGLTNDLIGTFLADAPRQLREIEAAHAARDPEALRRSAHYLRSGAMVLGLTAVSEHSRELEHVPADGYGSPGSAAMIARLRDELEPVLQALAAQLAGG